MGSASSKKKEKKIDRLAIALKHSILCDCKICTEPKTHKRKNPDCETTVFPEDKSPGMCNCANCQILKSQLNHSDNVCVMHGIIDHDCNSKKIHLRSIDSYYYDYDNGCNCMQCVHGRKEVMMYNIKTNIDLQRMIYPSYAPRRKPQPQYQEYDEYRNIPIPEPRPAEPRPAEPKKPPKSKIMPHSDSDSDEDIFE